MSEFTILLAICMMYHKENLDYAQIARSGPKILEI